ncbi:MAG: lysostaphin resistance A-like protein [Lachnospiraceae bacterium]|nr:CPBP family intramembrane metalloprotease [Lachnospiraceae bacterium]MDY4771276.1 type II CAAX endopeptidase family protein [Lachnospiraceae bacterium]
MAVTSLLLSIVLMIFGAGSKLLMQSSVWATGAAGVIVIPIAILLIRMDNNRRNPLLAKIHHLSLSNILWMIGLGASLAYVVNFLMAVLHIFELFPSYSEQTSKVLMSNRFWVTFLCGALIGPIAEEFVFRGLIFQRLKDYFRCPVAIVVSGLLFGIFHGNMAQFLYASVLGIIFAWFMEYFHTLEAPILLHISANAWSFALSYFGQDWFKVGNGILMLAVIGVQILIVISSFVYIRSNRKNVTVQ